MVMMMTTTMMGKSFFVLLLPFLTYHWCQPSAWQIPTVFLQDFRQHIRTDLHHQNEQHRW